MENDPTAWASDFIAVSGYIRGTPALMKAFAGQLIDTTFNSITNGLLKYRSVDEVFSIINQVSPIYTGIAKQHSLLNFNDLKHHIDELKAI